jgi:hypothetical protein
MNTLFQKMTIKNEKITFEELMNQNGNILPKREELSVITYNIGYPYGGYEGYNASQHVPNHQVNNPMSQHNYDNNLDCYRNYNDNSSARYDNDYWKHYEGANDKNYTHGNYENSNYNNNNYNNSNYNSSNYDHGRNDSSNHYGQYEQDSYAPHVAYNTYYSGYPNTYDVNYEGSPNTYAGYSGYSGSNNYGYSPMSLDSGYNYPSYT